MRQKWWRKPVPKSDGRTRVGSYLVPFEDLKDWCECQMNTFDCIGSGHPDHYKNDPSYNWRKRCDTATRLQINKRT